MWTSTWTSTTREQNEQLRSTALDEAHVFRISPTLASIGFQTLGTASVIAEEVGHRADTFAIRHGLLGYVNTLSPRLVSGTERIFGTMGDALDGLKARVQGSRAYSDAYFSQFSDLWTHPSGERLLDIVSRPTILGSDGFPKIDESAFRNFLDQVPHLFSEGTSVLRWLDAFEEALRASNGLLLDQTIASMRRSVESIRAIVFTAAVTAPPDLWLMRQILATHARNGLLDLLEQGREIISREDAALLELDENQLFYDLQFLATRGVLTQIGDGYSKSPSFSYRLGRTFDLPDEFRTDMTGLLKEGFSGTISAEKDLLADRWLQLPARAGKGRGWMAGRGDLEVGYRILPLVLALKAAGLLNGLRAGSDFASKRWPERVAAVLTEAGFLQNGKVTSLGARAFERGPGVYGIIGAYHPYLNHHEALLQKRGQRPWVERGKNIAASRDANRKSFQDVVSLLRDYTAETGTLYRVVIEHALGLAVGVQEFRKAFPDETIRYYGVDFEAAALQGAMQEQGDGKLPTGMKFVQADIGKPDPLVDFLREENALGNGVVMIVGNGFHEARGLSDAQLVAVFRRYREAGILLAFTEESGLTDRQIRSAGWNTYHAGFRWTHQVSGQALRSPWPMETASSHLSWTEIAEQAGYTVPHKFRKGTRAVFPMDLPEAQNPPISVTFLCIPQDKLGS